MSSTTELAKLPIIAPFNDGILKYINHGPSIGRCSRCKGNLMAKAFYIVSNTFWCPWCVVDRCELHFLSPSIFEPYDESFRQRMQKAMTDQIRLTHTGKGTGIYRNIDYSLFD